MLLAGNDCVTDDEATTQFVIWSIVAAPLIMGNDLRKVSAPMRKLLLNPEIMRSTKIRSASRAGGGPSTQATSRSGRGS